MKLSHDLTCRMLAGVAFLVLAGFAAASLATVSWGALTDTAPNAVELSSGYHVAEAVTRISAATPEPEDWIFTSKRPKPSPNPGK